MYYPKIRTLYKRDDRFKVNGLYTDAVFENIKYWLLTEKVDGTNMSISCADTPTGDTVATVRGRTERAQLEQFGQAIESVQLGSNTLSADEDSLHGRMRKLLLQRELGELEIFGEAFGPGVQSGGWYGPEQRFVVYDMRVNGNLWLPWDAVCGNAAMLGLETVPVVSNWATVVEATARVHAGFMSSLTTDSRPCEGVVARPATGELRDNRNKRVCWKLKHTDF